MLRGRSVLCSRIGFSIFESDIMVHGLYDHKAACSNKPWVSLLVIQGMGQHIRGTCSCCSVHLQWSCVAICVYQAATAINGLHECLGWRVNTGCRMQADIPALLWVTGDLQPFARQKSLSVHRLCFSHQVIAVHLSGGCCMSMHAKGWGFENLVSGVFACPSPESVHFKGHHWLIQVSFQTRNTIMRWLA